MVVGCLIGVGSMAILAFAHSSEWEIYLSTAIMGVGFGLAFSAMSGLIVAAVPPEQTGVASGMNANIRTIGGSIGSALMASIVTSHIRGQWPSDGERLQPPALRCSQPDSCSPLVPVCSSPPLTGRAPHHGADAEPEHAELGLLAAGTLVGDEGE